MSAVVTIGAWVVFVALAGGATIRDHLDDRDRKRHVRQMGAATRVTVGESGCPAGSWTVDGPDGTVEIEDWETVLALESLWYAPCAEPKRRLA